MSEDIANPSGADSEALENFDPVAAFSDFLDGKKPEDSPEAVQPETESNDQAESEQADDNEELEPETSYKVKVDGQEIEVPLSELLQGYSRESDYRQKTMALADSRRQLESYANEYGQYVEQNINNLQESIKMVWAQLPNINQPDPSLINDNPIEYLRQREAFDRARAQRQELVEHYQQAEQQREQLSNQQFQTNLQKGREIVLQAISDWNNPNIMAQEQREILDDVARYGFSPEEFSRLTDPRYVVYMRDALINSKKAKAYDDMMAKSNMTAKKVESLPVKSEKPGKGRSGNAAQDGRTDAMKNLAKNQTREAAAAVFSKML